MGIMVIVDYSARFVQNYVAGLGKRKNAAELFAGFALGMALGYSLPLCLKSLERNEAFNNRSSIEMADNSRGKESDLDSFGKN